MLCPDWTGLDSDSGSSAGFDWIRVSGMVDLDWTGSFQLNPFHALVVTKSKIENV